VVPQIQANMMYSARIPILSQCNLTNSFQLGEAAKGGIFYLEMAQAYDKHLNDALQFSYRFPNDEKIKQYTDGKFGGYHQREHDQIESFYVERKDWSSILPANIQELACEMDQLANNLLKAILEQAGIPKELWSDGTGLLTAGGGQKHFSFNHYRFKKQTAGIKSHQDIGFLTILFVEKAGLEAVYKGEWVDVPPLANHFVVLLGKAFEILVDDCSKVSGAWHRVRQLTEERVSFAVTCDNDENQSVKRYLRKMAQLATVHESYHDYLEECFKAIYPMIQ
jgi:hypothetical protein